MSAISRRGWLQYRFLLKQPAAISSFYVITLHFARGSQNYGVRRSGNERCSREVALRWAHAVSTGMGDRVWHALSPRFVSSHPGQLSLLPSVGQENRYQPKCNDALWLGTKGRHCLFHSWPFLDYR